MKKFFDLVKSSIFYNPLNVAVVWPSAEQTGAWNELEGDLSCDVVCDVDVEMFLNTSLMFPKFVDTHLAGILSKIQIDFLLNLHLCKRKSINKHMMPRLWVSETTSCYVTARDWTQVFWHSGGSQECL